MKYNTENSNSDSVIWVHNFSSSELRQFYQQFMRFENRDDISIIPIIIDSLGGSVYVLLAMRDIIKSSNKPVATIALGKAMSAGALLLAAGTNGLRFASANAHLLIHEILSIAEGKASDLKVDVAHTEHLMNLVLKNFSEDTGLDMQFLKRKISQLNNADWFITPQEALKLHIVDHIGIPRFTTSDKSQLILAGQPFTQSKIKTLTQKIQRITQRK